MKFSEKNVHKKALLKVHSQSIHIKYDQIHKYQHHLNFVYVFYQVVLEKNGNMKVILKYYFQFRSVLYFQYHRLEHFQNVNDLNKIYFNQTINTLNRFYINSP